MLQFLFGLLILRWDFGKEIFHCLGDKVSDFLGYTDAGTQFVFGYLINDIKFEKNTTNMDNDTLPAVFAFKVNKL